jgi:ketosteroid isomerase-like protein
MKLKPRLGLLSAIALLPAIAACQKPAPDPAREAAAINARIEAFNRAARARDAEKVAAIDAADIRGYGGGGPDVVSRDQDLKANQAIMADPAYSYQLKAEHTEVAKSGDIAFQTGLWEASATNPATKAAEHASGHYMAGWRKEPDGAWRIAAFTMAFPPSPAPAATSPASKAPPSP